MKIKKNNHLLPFKIILLDSQPPPIFSLNLVLFICLYMCEHCANRSGYVVGTSYYNLYQLIVLIKL